MQDNPFNEKFMNEAWANMKSSLDQEMPQRKRRVFIWWIFPVLLVISFSLLWFQNDKEKPEPITQSITLPVEQEPSLNEINELPSHQTVADLKQNHDSIIKQENKDSKENFNTKTIQNRVTHSFFNFTQSKISYQLENETKPPIILSKSSSNPNPENPVQKIPSFTGKLIEPIALLDYKTDKILINSRVEGYSNDFTTAAKPIKKPLHIGIFSNYDAFPIHQNSGFSFGFYYRKNWTKWYLETGLGGRRSSAKFEYPDNGTENAITANDEMKQPDTALDPSFGGVNLDSQVSMINASTTSLIAPLKLEFRFNDRWGISSGIQLTYLVSIQNKNKGLVDGLDTFYDLQSSSNKNRPSNDNLLDGFKSRFFFEPNINLHRRFGRKLEIDLGYIHGRSQLLKSEAYEWNRNRIQLGLHYRLR